MRDNSEIITLVLIFFLGAAVSGTMISMVCENRSIKAGCAQYHPETGKFEYKQGDTNNEKTN